MRKKIPFLILVLVCRIASAQVTFYTGANYTGKSETFNEGYYRYMPQRFADSLTSFKIVKGYKINLYSLPDYKGKMVVLYTAAKQIPESWGTVAGSMTISRIGKNEIKNISKNPWALVKEVAEDTMLANIPSEYKAGDVIVFAEPDYKGKSLKLTSQKSLSTAHLSVSSVKIPEGKRLFIFSETGLRGNSDTLYGDNNILPEEWNDKIYSMVVNDPLADFLRDSGLGGIGTIGHGGGLGISGTGSGGGGSASGSIGSGGGNWGYGSNKSGTGVNVVIFDKCNFAGQNRTLGVGEYPAIPSGNTLKISSIRIPPGKKVLVFSGKKFTGFINVFTASQNCLPAAWNDKIQSLKITEE